MFDELIRMKLDIETLKTAFGKSMKVGPIEELDAVKGYRIKLGVTNDGTPVLSPWYPHPESGGDTSTWVPLSKGQIVGVINPTGDPRQGVMFRGGFSGQNQPPSENLSENIYQFGHAKVLVDGTGIYVSFGDGSKISITGDNITVQADSIDNLVKG